MPDRDPAEDLRRWEYVFIFSSFRAIIYESRTVRSQTNGGENRI